MDTNRISKSVSLITGMKPSRVCATALTAQLLFAAFFLPLSPAQAGAPDSLSGKWAFIRAEFNIYRQSDSALLETVAVDSVENLRAAEYPFGLVFRTVDFRDGVVECTLASSFGIEDMSYRLSGNELTPLAHSVDTAGMTDARRAMARNALRPLYYSGYSFSRKADGNLIMTVVYPSFGKEGYAFPLSGRMTVEFVPFNPLKQ